MANAVTRERNSNHELMRILSMFFIVLGHVFLFGKLLDTPNKSMSIIYYFFEFILIVHVNSYVLVSGYYQSFFFFYNFMFFIKDYYFFLF